MSDHKIQMYDEDGTDFETLEDIFPVGQFKILIVGKVPAPNSVAMGHYFQGSMGQDLWNTLRNYNLFQAPIGIHNDIGEDDFLVQHGYGITDIVKKARTAGHEPTLDEYRVGANILLEKIHCGKPDVVLFVFKGAFKKLLKARFRIDAQLRYGFNNKYSDKFFGCRLFVFPMCGTPATTTERQVAMRELELFINN